MNPTLDKQLCDKYPKIFRDRNGDMTKTCMVWGFSCDDGWYNIIDNLCYALSNLYQTSVKIPDASSKFGYKYELYDPPQVIASQIKEKMSSLRFYYDLEFYDKFNKAYEAAIDKTPYNEFVENYHKHINGMITLAEVISSKTCEISGKEGELHVANGWYKTLNREVAKNDEYAKFGYVPFSEIDKK